MFSRTHPGSLLVVGAAWCNDSVHFICNSGVLAAFMGLKANSINTNFRDHGFEIVRFSLSELTKEFPCLPANNNWKKRANVKHSFTPFTPLAEIERIPCGEVVRNDIVITESDFTIPAPIIAFIRQNQATELKVFHILAGIEGPTAPELISRAFQDWWEFGGDGCITKIEKFTDRLTRPLENKSDIDRVKANTYILLRDGDNDPSSQELDFGSYFLFTLRYGFLQDSLEVILQLTEPDGFHPWFQPLLGRSGSRLLLGCHARNAWFVRVAEAPGKFVLTYKQVEKIMLTPITFNPLRTDQRLSVDMPSGPVFTMDWPSLLYSVLHLNSRECLECQDLGLEFPPNGDQIARWTTIGEEPQPDLKLDGLVAVPLPLTRRRSTRSVLT
jgi:hypothetical protein